MTIEQHPEVSPSTDNSQHPNRRSFLKKSAVSLTAAGAVSTALSSAVYAQGSDLLKVGLVGCGGRGTGAAGQALTADSGTELVAMADVFEDQLERSLKNLKSNKSIGDRVNVADKKKFIGFDAYKEVIDMSDVVILTTTPHFRPMQLRAAIEAGKHVFCEKPVAVDAPGIRSVLQTTEMAREKNLALVSGLCWRYHAGMQATFEQIHNGAIGDITAMQCSYNSGGVWDPRRTREQCKSEMEYQVRNWYYYTWLSGDFNVEQHVHSLDKMAWAMKDATPLKVSGSGGRIQRTDPKYGNIYDHFNVVYEYENGVKAFASARHWKKSSTDVSDHVFGTRGRVDVFKHRIFDLDGKEVWKFKGKSKSMYQVEHDELFASIRSANPINNGVYMSQSSMMAIAGRISAYTGKTLSWEELMNSKEDLSPEKYDWVDIPVPEVAVPGKTKFV